jgi:hypothetical protein
MVSPGTSDSKPSQNRRPDAPAAPDSEPPNPIPTRIVLAMQGVTKSYPNGRVALRGVDLMIP